MSVRNALQKVDTVRHAAGGGGALKQERHPGKLSARGLAGVRSARKPRKLFI